MGRLEVLLKQVFGGALGLEGCGEELMWLIDFREGSPDFRGGAPSGLPGIMVVSPHRRNLKGLFAGLASERVV